MNIAWKRTLVLDSAGDIPGYIIIIAGVISQVVDLEVMYIKYIYIIYIYMYAYVIQLYINHSQ